MNVCGRGAHLYVRIKLAWKGTQLCQKAIGDAVGFLA